MQLARTVSTVLFILTLGVATAVHADDESSANRLLVSSVQLMKQYEGIPADDPEQYEARLNLLREVRDNLASIVDDYPGSSLAVEIITEERAKTLVLADIEAEIARVEAQPSVDDYNRAYAFIGVAEAQASAGDVAGARQTALQALETAQSIENEVLRETALAAVAVAQASAGDVAGALETAQSIENELNHAMALAAVAEVQASAGDVAGALETAQSIEFEVLRETALAAVAVAQASAGDVEGALETAQSIEFEWARTRALAAITAAAATLK